MCPYDRHLRLGDRLGRPYNLFIVPPLCLKIPTFRNEAKNSIIDLRNVTLDAIALESHDVLTQAVLEYETPATAHYEKCWLAANQVLCYRFFDTERATIDEWFADVAKVKVNWNSECPLRLLLDLRADHAFITAYGRARALSLARLRPGLPGRTALLVSDRVATQIASLVLRQLAADHRERLIFGDETAAMDWLLRADTMSQP